MDHITNININSPIFVSLPWGYGEISKKKKKDDLRTIDSIEQVKKCLNCPYNECIDCLSNTRPNAGRKQKVNAEQLRIMIDCGDMSRTEICKALGITERTFYRYSKSIIKNGGMNYESI